MVIKKSKWYPSPIVFLVSSFALTALQTCFLYRFIWARTIDASWMCVMIAVRLLRLARFYWFLTLCFHSTSCLVCFHFSVFSVVFQCSQCTFLCIFLSVKSFRRVWFHFIVFFSFYVYYIFRGSIKEASGFSSKILSYFSFVCILYDFLPLTMLLQMFLADYIMCAYLVV